MCTNRQNVCVTFSNSSVQFYFATHLFCLNSVLVLSVLQINPTLIHTLLSNAMEFKQCFLNAQILLMAPEINLLKYDIT